MILYPILLTVITFFSTLLGGVVVAKYASRFGMFMAFAAAVLIAVPIFDLLPQAFKLAAVANVPLENVMYVLGIGFLVLYIVQRYLLVSRVCQGELCENVRPPRVGATWGAAQLVGQSFLDGFAIGVSFQADFHVGLIVAVAVIANDFSDGINTVTVMLSSGNSMKSSLGMVLLDGAAPILGAATTLFIGIPERYLIFLLPFFAGGFLYLGASELLPKACEKNPPVISFLASLVGFLFVFLVTRVLSI
jgi:ZIP family zinc transporter